MAYRLVIGNKAYSSWSFRPWILMRHFRIPFDERVVPLDTPDTASGIAAVSPSGRVPALIDGNRVVWDSLAIVEYLAEAYPKKAIWPRRSGARAHARSVSAEMHSGFQALRSDYPMNMRREPRAKPPTEAVARDVARIEAIIAHARAIHGGKGDFLFGGFSAADAMYAPVVNRLMVYDVPVSPGTRHYCETMAKLPAYAAWSREAAAEPAVIEKYERA